jgi:hypothetical protein
MNPAVSTEPLTESFMTESSGISTHPLLDKLPDPQISPPVSPRRARLHVDLMLVALEALEVGGSEVMLAAAKELELDDIVKNRVSLWRLRATNPWRRSHTRRALKIEEAKALVAITCQLSRRLTVNIRQMLLAYRQMQSKQLPLNHHFLLSQYLEKFRAHFRSRMNPRRTMVIAYKEDQKLDELAISLLNQLIFCTGTSGMERLWISLFDGEVD